jgi:hypothetical protein
VLALRLDMTMTGLDALPYRRIIRPPWPIDPDEERTA